MGVARNFRELFDAISPPWLLKPDGFGVRFYQGMIGFLADLAAEAATQAIKAGWVNQATSPEDALPSIGQNFNIEQVPGEDNVEYRARLYDTPGAWELWEESATILFAENAFAPFGVPASQVLFRAVKDWLVPNPENWSRFWIILQDTVAFPLPWIEATWGGAVWGTWGTQATWGSSATQAEIEGALKLICKWKSAEEVGVEIILQFASGELWGEGTWGAPRLWSSTGIVRWPMTRFWGAQFKPTVWGDNETYRPQFKAVWGGKIRFS